MSNKLKRYTDFLTARGTEEVEHTGEDSFLTHLTAVHRDLKRWGYEEHVCLAGLFHAIYGTDKFRRYALPLDQRNDVRKRIGERAERLAYFFCAMDRDSFDKSLARGIPPYSMKDRFTGERVEFTDEDFEDLCKIQLVDWLEQVPRSKQWAYRRETHRNLAARLGEFAMQERARVYSMESTD
ncbi:MAG: hypothetical protein ACI8UO_001914 [Verrucomicrobiales bacterium]|jgi:hypothetical protein